MLRIVLLMLVAMSSIPAGDAAGKMLTGAGISSGFVAWSRFALGLCFVLPLLSRPVLGLLHDRWVLVRGLCLAGGIWSIQSALETAPLGDTFAIFFVGPILSFVLAGWFLGERLRRDRIMAITLGFAGVLIVLRPGFAPVAGLEYALLAGVCYGVFLTISRWFATRARPLDLVVTQMLIGAVVLAPVGLPQIPAPDLRIYGLVLASAVFSMAGNVLLVVAYRMSEASVLAPMVYFQIFAAVLLGWLFFDQIPSALSLAGMGIILVAGIAAARLR